ncbi:head-tail connector protein [Bacillus atrophaeus]|uniref:head-tail connector protein n=1 Tax=Bacillus atrophaeus TaxID=1452 RepID=UPI002E22113C|nr:head-tail connector protein [Bacillus atrophaeus]
MAVSLSEVKAAVRIDTDTDDKLLEKYIDAATDTLIFAIGDEVEGFYEDNPIFDVAVMRLVDHYYKNRSATSNGVEVRDIPFGITPSIIQLKGRYLHQLQKQEGR